MSEEVDEKYFSECYDPSLNRSFVDFCDLKYTDPESQDNPRCKNDFCFMCCNLRDFMYNHSHSYTTIVKCENKCIEKYKVRKWSG